MQRKSSLPEAFSGRNPALAQINVDASFYVDLLSRATDVVARDEKGQLISAATWFLPHIASASSAEIVAIRNGLYLAANIGCSKVEVESNCEAALECILSADDYLGQDITVVQECSSLAKELTHIKFVNCSREANQVADGLASYCFSSKVSDFWNDSVPEFVSQLVVTDISIV